MKYLSIILILLFIHIGYSQEKPRFKHPSETSKMILADWDNYSRVYEVSETIKAVIGNTQEGKKYPEVPDIMLNGYWIRQVYIQAYNNDQRCNYIILPFKHDGYLNEIDSDKIPGGWRYYLDGTSAYTLPPENVIKLVVGEVDTP